MKSTRILILTLLVLLAGRDVAGAVEPSIGVGLHIGPSGNATADLGFFYDDLAPYGYWVDRPQLGWAWAPRGMPAAWRPYQDGYWALTDSGWTWITDEPFGWATYHYGSWALDPALGWLWVPGDEWAPAWVSWREGDGYIGWAPRAPARVTLVPEAWVFVPTSRFLEPQLVTYAVAPTQVVNIFSRTHTVTHNRFFYRGFRNQGVAVGKVQRWTGRPVPRYQLTDLSPKERHGGARIEGNRIALFRPKVAKAVVAPPPARLGAAKAVMTPRAVADTVRTARAARAAATGHAPPGAMRRQGGTEHRRLAARTVAEPDTGGRQKVRPSHEARRGGSRKASVDRPLHQSSRRMTRAEQPRPPRETRLRHGQGSPRPRATADRRPSRHQPTVRHERTTRPQQRLRSQQRAGRSSGTQRQTRPPGKPPGSRSGKKGHGGPGL